MKNTDKLFQSITADAVLVVSEKNRMYFTGFASTFGYLVLFPNNKNVFITDPRYFEMAQSLVEDGVEVKLIANGISANSMVQEVLQQNNAKIVGFEDNELTVSEYNSLQQALTNVQFVAVGNQINVTRSFKDEKEIEYIKKAQEITDAAFAEILTFIKPGITEKQLACELEYRMAKNGAEGLAFDTIIASGINSSKPHAHPTEKVIELGDPVTMDFGARYHGYCADMTRTVFVGEPSEQMRNIYNIVLQAQQMAIDNAFAGIAGKEFDSYCREVIKANGFAEYFTHSTGHSLGIDIHETPYASMRSVDSLMPNQLITCEPGIYIPGIGGVRIEDLLLIKEDGIEDLTKSNKELIIL